MNRTPLPSAPTKVSKTSTTRQPAKTPPPSTKIAKSTASTPLATSSKLAPKHIASSSSYTSAYTSPSPVLSTKQPSFARKNVVTSDKYDKNKQADPFSHTKNYKSYVTKYAPSPFSSLCFPEILQWCIPTEEYLAE